MNFAPALNQFEEIIGLTHQKRIVYALKLCLDAALNGFSENDKDFLDYKYFRLKPRDYYKDYDASSRGYFRKQVRLAEKFAELLQNEGYSDERFEEECLSIEFFREMLARVKEKENLNRKNKTAEEKEQVKKIKSLIAKNAGGGVKTTFSTVSA